jgi:hypothetical protein
LIVSLAITKSLEILMLACNAQQANMPQQRARRARVALQAGTVQRRVLKVPMIVFCVPLASTALTLGPFQVHHASSAKLDPPLPAMVHPV